MTAIEKIVSDSSQEEGGTPCYRGREEHGEDQELVRRQREVGTLWARVLMVVPMGRNRQDRVGRLRTGSFE